MGLKDKFVIALDFDGVVTNPYKLKAEYLQERGYKVDEEHCSPLSCLKLGVSKEDHDYATKRSFTTTSKDLPLEKDVIKNFNKIRKLPNVEIFILSSRTDEMLDHLNNFLRHYKIRVEGIINTKNKSKTGALREIKANVFIEDSPFKLWQIIKEEPGILNECKLILYRNTQNKIEKKPNSSIIEVYDWNDLSKMIAKYASEQKPI